MWRKTIHEEIKRGSRVIYGDIDVCNCPWGTARRVINLPFVLFHLFRSVRCWQPILDPQSGRNPASALHFFFYLQGRLSFILLDSVLRRHRVRSDRCCLIWELKRAYLGMTKQRCLGSLLAGLLILHGWSAVMLYYLYFLFHFIVPSSPFSCGTCNGKPILGPRRRPSF